MTVEELRKLYPFESKFLKIRNYRYHYIDEGSGEPLLLLHGNPSWSFMFRNVIRELSKTNRVIAPDHLGCGLSDKPQEYNYRLELHIENIEELVMRLELENINLLMHDWGGAIGMGFASRSPEKVKRLIICNTAAFTFKRMPLRIAICRLPYLGKKIVMDWNLFCKAASFMTTVKPLPPEIKAAYMMPYDTPEKRVAIYRFVQDIPMSFADNSYELLKTIESSLWMFKETPTLILWGMKDWCFNAKVLKKWKDFLPYAKVKTFDNAGHWLFEDCPEEINSEIKDFVSY